MRQSVRSLLLVIVSVAFMGGCSSDDTSETFNKPALFWYKKIGKSISSGELDQADTYYISLKSEHLRSPLLPTAIMMLAHAHMNEEEYLLANYYLDEYNKRFSDASNREYVDFMKLKASFMGVQDAYKDQQLIINSIAQAKTYVMRYPDSSYLPLVNTILVRLYMSQYLLNENIAALYTRIGKPQAVKIYKEKNQGSVVEMSDIKAPQRGLISQIID
jgi:outer membrane protein assembly factor BamD